MKIFLCIFLCVLAVLYTLNILHGAEKKNAIATAIMYTVSVIGIVILLLIQ